MRLPAVAVLTLSVFLFFAAASAARPLRIPVSCRSRPAVRLCAIHTHRHKTNVYRERVGLRPFPYLWRAERYPGRRDTILTLWVHRQAAAKRHLRAFLRRSDPVGLGRALAAGRYGWAGAEWSALYALWMRESGWRPSALNTSSGACGIPQFVPCRDWGDTRRQILDGLAYIKARYGDPAAALAHSDSYGWY